MLLSYKRSFDNTLNYKYSNTSYYDHVIKTNKSRKERIDWNGRETTREKRTVRRRIKTRQSRNGAVNGDDWPRTWLIERHFGHGIMGTWTHQQTCRLVIVYSQCTRVMVSLDGYLRFNSCGPIFFKRRRFFTFFLLNCFCARDFFKF